MLVREIGFDSYNPNSRKNVYRREQYAKYKAAGWEGTEHKLDSVIARKVRNKFGGCW